MVLECCVEREQMQRIDLPTGAVFGYLTVIKEARTDSPRRMYACRCSCGAKVNVRVDHLRGGHTQSCGRCNLIGYKGKRKTLKAWADSIGVGESTLRMRLKRMTMQEAMAMGKPR
jgi:hypothetical protein